MAGNRFVRLVALLCLLSSAGLAQGNRYMVFFRDKSGITQTISKPIEFLSERAIQRRLDQNIAITERDLPVNKSYVKGLGEAGATPLYTTRWMNGALIVCEPSTLSAIEALPYVERVEYVAPPAKNPSGGRKSFNLRKNSSHLGLETEVQLKMIGVDRMHAKDVTGKGVFIAILDSGFPGVDAASAFQHLVSENRISDVSFDFVHRTPDVFGYDDHGTEVLSVIAGLVPDAFTGGAFNASFQLFVTEDVTSEYRVEEYNWLFAAERADSAGADVIHSSLGYYDFDDASMNYSTQQMDGKTAVVTRAAQWAFERGIVVVTSAGNEGNIPTWRIVTAPADGADVIAVGGVNHTGQKVSSSSIGPASDGRVKPDVVALGSAVRVVKATGQISTASGTSLAAPLVTSLVAGIIEHYPDLSNKEIVSLLRSTASQADKPDNLLGYGIPNFQAVVNYQSVHHQTAPFELYPNPLKDGDTLTISPRDVEIFDSWRIEIVSSQGQILASEQVRFDWLNRAYHTTLTGLPAGIYYVRIFASKRKDTFKIVKLR